MQLECCQSSVLQERHSDLNLLPLLTSALHWCLRTIREQRWAAPPRRISARKHECRAPVSCSNLVIALCCSGQKLIPMTVSTGCLLDSLPTTSMSGKAMRQTRPLPSNNSTAVSQLSFPKPRTQVATPSACHEFTRCFATWKLLAFKASSALPLSHSTTPSCR